MTDKAKKLLVKLQPKQRQLVLSVLEKLRANDESGLDIKPLQGHKHMFRARVGSYRIIYWRRGDQFKQVSITKRDDQTYRDF